MTMPKFHEFFLEVLKSIEDGDVHFGQDVIKRVVASSNLTQEELEEEHEKGGNKAKGRIQWAITYLVQSGAVIRPKRGFVQISDLGTKLIKENTSGISLNVLSETEGFKAWGERMSHGKKSEAIETQRSEALNDHAPIENIETAFKILRSALVGELLDRIRNEDPEFLEKLVLEQIGRAHV